MDGKVELMAHMGFPPLGCALRLSDPDSRFDAEADRWNLENELFLEELEAFLDKEVCHDG